MLKVNAEKLLNDVAEIKNDIANADATALHIATEMAAQRGFGEDFAKKLKDMILESEPSFNIATKEAKLASLMVYVEEVPDVAVADETIA